MRAEEGDNAEELEVDTLIHVENIVDDLLAMGVDMHLRLVIEVDSFALMVRLAFQVLGGVEQSLEQGVLSLVSHSQEPDHLHHGVSIGVVISHHLLDELFVHHVLVVLE